MPRLFCWLLLLGMLGIPLRAASAQVAEGTATPTITSTPTPAAVVISSPSEGAAIQGNVTIMGNTAVEGFSSAEVSFTYSGSSGETWFLITEGSEPVSNGVLARWDTTTITDGNYDVRLVVNLVDASQKTYTRTGLRVRNYSPIETNTPTPVTPTSTPQPGDTPIPSETPTPTASPVPPTATALPANPAELSTGDIQWSLARGGLAVVGFFAVMGIYQGLKYLRRRE